MIELTGVKFRTSIHMNLDEIAKNNQIQNLFEEVKTIFANNNCSIDKEILI
jgi:hypothetical protein